MKRIYFFEIQRPSHTAAKLRLTRALLLGNKSSKTKEDFLTYVERLQTGTRTNSSQVATEVFLSLF